MGHPEISTFPKKCQHILVPGVKYLFFAPFKFYLYFFPYTDDEGALLWSWGDFFGIFNVFALTKRSAADTRQQFQLRCSAILLCNSELERELKASVQYIFNNTFPLLTSLRRLKIIMPFLKTRTPKKSQSDEVHSLSLPEQTPKDLGLLK